MSTGEKTPLVIDEGQVEQLQPGQEVASDALPDDHIDRTRRLLRELVRRLVYLGFDLPSELVIDAMEDA